MNNEPFGQHFTNEGEAPKATGIFTDAEETTVRAMFKDPRYDPEEFKRVLKKYGFKRKNSMRNQPCLVSLERKQRIVAGTDYLGNAGAKYLILETLILTYTLILI